MKSVIIRRYIAACLVLILVTVIYSSFKPSKRKIKKNWKNINLLAHMSLQPPCQDSVRSAKSKLISAASTNVSSALILYHIDKLHSADSLDLKINNALSFISSIEKHASSVFYMISVETGDENPLYHYIPQQFDNVAIIHWNTDISTAMEAHLKVLYWLGADDIRARFDTIYFLSNEVRGPMAYRENNGWLSQYNDIFAHNSKVGMVGATITCDIVPHVQTYMFAIRAHLASAIINNSANLNAQLNSTKPWLLNSEKIGIGITNTVMNMGYNIASMYDRKKEGNLVYPTHDSCVHYSGLEVQPNPLTRCDLNTSDLIFLKWNDPQSNKEHFCDKTIATMDKELTKLADAYPQYKWVVPESLKGGELQSLYREFTSEMDYYPSSLHARANNHAHGLLPHRPYHLPIGHTGHNNTGKNKVLNSAVLGMNSKVCLLVRCASGHRLPSTADTSYVPAENMINYGIDDLAASLLRQTTADWKAFFFVTDPQPFEEELEQMLNRYNNSRLIMVKLDPIYKPKYTKADGGYTATDHVLSLVLKDKECLYISATNGDNIYGSDVLNSVLNAKTNHHQNAFTASSFNSRNRYNGSSAVGVSRYGHHYVGKRGGGSGAVMSNGDGDGATDTVGVRTGNGAHASNIRSGSGNAHGQQHKQYQQRIMNSPAMVLVPVDSRNYAELVYQLHGSKKDWKQRCVGLHAMMAVNKLGFVYRSVPWLGRIDLAAVFLHRERLKSENLLFGNFTNPSKYTCLGCQDGYFTEYLVRNRFWKYVQLPVDGLKSIVFHGPSPTWCIASGNVWFDHPKVFQVGCYTHKTVHQIRYSNSNLQYDWGAFAVFGEICLRFIGKKGAIESK